MFDIQHKWLNKYQIEYKAKFIVETIGQMCNHFSHFEL